MDQLDEVRSKIDLVQLISEYLPLQKAGRNYKANCPFHSEKTPSFVVSPERQIWKCFGCGKAGDAFGFLMEFERMDFGEALRTLAKRVGVILKTYRPSPDEARKELLFQVNHLAAEFFHYLLLNHPSGKKALDYILQRGISKDSLKLFKIGYSPNQWDNLQKYLVGKKGFLPQDLENSGLIIPSHQPSINYYDRFRNRLMFPLVDHRGNICGFAGRVLDPEIKEAKYVNTPETLVYHKSDLLYPLNITKEEIKKNNQAVVVEGELDAISSFQVGVKNVVAIKGSALSENQVKLLKRFAENLVLALDADVAGDAAARRGIEIADKEGLNIRVLELEKFKDPDEAAQKDPKFYKEKLKQSIPFYEFLINSAIKRFGTETPEGKRKVGEEITPVLARVENEIIKNHYLRLLAEKLSVSEESVINQIKKAPFVTFIKNIPQAEKVSKPREELLEEYLLSLFFQKGEFSFLTERTEFINSPVYQKILKLLADFTKTNKAHFSSKEFSEYLPAELKEAFNNLYLLDLGEHIEDEGWFLEEIKKTERELKILQTKKEMESLAKEIKKMEIAGQTGSGAWEKIQNRFRELSNSLTSIIEGKEV